MPRLAQEGVVGADAIFACLGPALEIYSRYNQVEKANGEIVTLKEYLERVWGVVSQEALRTIFDTTEPVNLEADARLTVIWFWVIKSAHQQIEGSELSSETVTDQEADEEEANQRPYASQKKKHKGYMLEFDAVRKLAQGLGVELQTLNRPGGILTIQGASAILHEVAYRESHLLGFQLDMFGEDKPIRTKNVHTAEPKAKLNPIQHRMSDLLGEEIADHNTGDTGQLSLFNIRQNTSKDDFASNAFQTGKTLLDRLHQAMLLFGRGHSTLLNSFLKSTDIGDDHQFWKLAQALSALYPSGSDEKRWVDGVLSRKKSLGF
jgi:hypothetical protein